MHKLKDKTLPIIREDISDPNLKIIPAPKFMGKAILRFLILIGLGSMLYFLYWFFSDNHIGFTPLYWMLFFAFGFRFLKLLHEWYHYWSISVPERPKTQRDWKVDMITTYVPGEPYDMILETLEAMVNVRYPHKTYLCDEGNDPFLIEKCKELGVIHSYRGKDKTNAKAGNVNYCLQNHADGEIVVVLDPDHLPSPDFIDRVLPYFKDEEIGYVQCIQAYHNRNESFIAKGAAEQTYHFYGPMMMSMNTYGTAQAIGANCTFRRKALDSIGGHMPGLSEDMHTAMRLHAAGWESIYLPEALTRGQVPETLSGYYKQQLKWSRGSFDLLFNVVPKIAKGLTWRQIIHYVTIPLFFLSGLIGLIDITVPIISLFTAQSPWKVQMVELGKAALPLILMIMVIRQYVQRYVLEEHERGFHFMGGALLFATWWVHLTGLIYTFFNVKVPYIPTPKGDEKINEWKLSLPNLGVILLSAIAITYGLSIDWSPYSMIMASYASINIFMLGFVFLVSQQKSIKSFYSWLYKGQGILSGIRSLWYHLRHNIVYPAFRNTGIALFMIAGVFWGAFTFLKVEKGLDISREASLSIGSRSPFYLGGVKGSTYGFQIIEGRLDKPEDMFSNFKENATSVDNGTLPLLRLGIDPSIGDSLQSIYWKSWGNDIKKMPQGILIQPYHIGDSSLDAASWRSYVRRLGESGVWNAQWIWKDDHDSLDINRFPGASWVDLVSLPLGTDSARQRAYGKPILLEGQTDQGWKAMDQKYQDWAASYPWVHGIIVEESQAIKETWVNEIEAVNQRQWGSPVSQAQMRTRIRKWIEELGEDARETLAELELEKKYEIVRGDKAPRILVDGRPTYIKGVAYNPSHDWRDGFTPLTRIKLNKDFERIKAMGGNTLRRYASSWYDTNILMAADAQELNVIYGFWLSPDVDYSRDSAKVKEQIKKVMNTIEDHGDHPSIMAWSLGNETFYRLRKSMPPLRLSEARISYLILIDELARMLKEAGEHSLITTGIAHHAGLEGALVAFDDFTSNFDFVGINAHYSAQLAEVTQIMDSFASDIPYLISEFSPGGYWNESYTSLDPNRQIQEPSDYRKAQQYSYNWTQHIKQNQGKNLGGVAYCWQDRIEGTATWFGLTTLDGEVKPSYYALREVWTGEKDEFPLADAKLVVPPARPGEMPFLPFRVISSNNLRAGLSYEWKVVNTQTQELVADIDKVSKWHMLKVDFPMEEGEYRVYITISDKDGHAVEASRGFKVPYP